MFVVPKKSSLDASHACRATRVAKAAIKIWEAPIKQKETLQSAAMQNR